MYTIEKGLGKNWRWLAVAFACFAVICSFATGNAIQSFTVSDQIYSETVQLLGANHFLTVKHVLWSSFAVSYQQVINGLVLAALVGMVIIGGIRRIGRVTGYLAPVMAAVFVFSEKTHENSKDPNSPFSVKVTLALLGVSVRHQDNRSQSSNNPRIQRHWDSDQMRNSTEETVQHSLLKLLP